MIVCPYCNSENFDGALVCNHCHKLLIQIPATMSHNQTVTLDQRKLKPEPELPVRGVALLKADEIELDIEGATAPLTVHVSQQVMFGRHTPVSPTAQFIDLVPYGGYKKGISRAHAMIERMPDGWSLTDLGSSNGTWLDDDPLTPYAPRRLASNSRLRLGQLPMLFYCYEP